MNLTRTRTKPCPRPSPSACRDGGSAERRLCRLERAVEPVTGEVVQGNTDVRKERVLPTRWVRWAWLPMEEVGSDVELGAEERRVRLCRVPGVEDQNSERRGRLLTKDLRYEAGR